MLGTISEVWRFRGLIRVLVVKELKLRYRRSVLGFAWTMLNPLLTMIILTVVFSHALRVQLDNFAVFVLSALLPWNFFSQSISGGALSIVHNESLLRSVYVPRSVFPIALVMSHLINLLLALIPLLLVMAWQSVPVRVSVIALPLYLACLLLFTVGLTLTLAAWTVFFRDLAQIVEVGMQALFYLTPIIYPLSILPERYAPFFRLNPLYYQITSLRALFFEGVFPSGTFLAVTGASSIVMLLIGLAVFRRHENQFLHYLS